MQIRTRDMHRTAEYGIAAHWRYKEQGRNGLPHAHAAAEIDDMAWMRQLLDWQREAADPGSSWSRCVTTSRYKRSSCSPRRATSSPCLPDRPRRLLRTPCTPRWGIAVSARGQRQAGRLERKLENGKWSRFSPPKLPTPGRPETGSPLSCRRAPKPRSASGSPKSAAKKRWRRARTRSLARCAAADFPAAARQRRGDLVAGERAALLGCPPSTRPSVRACLPRHVVQRLLAQLGAPTALRTNSPNGRPRRPCRCGRAPVTTPASPFRAHQER